MEKKSWLMLFLLFLLNIFAINPKAAEPAFTAQQISVDGVPVVRLIDVKRGIEVSIVPSLNNMAYEMKVHGKNILYFPAAKLSDFQKRPRQSGIPFLAPWANRIDSTGFWANGKKYEFNQTLGNLSKDQNNLPLHGVLSNSTSWHVSAVERRSGIGACHQQVCILEISRSDGPMAVCP